MIVQAGIIVPRVRRVSYGCRSDDHASDHAAVPLLASGLQHCVHKRGLIALDINQTFATVSVKSLDGAKERSVAVLFHPAHEQTRHPKGVKQKVTSMLLLFAMILP